VCRIDSPELCTLLSFCCTTDEIIVCLLQKKLGGKNAEYEEEKRQEKEKQEKAIGLLTYLGQGSAELEGACSTVVIAVC